VTTVGGIPVTSGSRTLLDLAAVLSHAALERAVDEALYNGAASLDGIKQQLCNGGPGKGGTVALRRLMQKRSPLESKTESQLEGKLMRLLESHGFPIGVPHYEIWDGGSHIARVDLAYPDLRLAIEADGYRYHSNSADRHSDQVRSNGVVSVGWRELRFTAQDDRDPRRFLAELSRAFSVRRSA
jgi:hypothetical protein